MSPLVAGLYARVVGIGSSHHSRKAIQFLDKPISVRTLTPGVRNVGKLLETNLASLNGLAEKLLIQEVLDGEEIDQILKEKNATGEVSYSL